MKTLEQRLQECPSFLFEGKAEPVANSNYIPSLIEEKCKNYIPINIWDDFYDDGYIPDGKIQETHAYVEEYENIDDDKKRRIIFYLSEILEEIDLGSVSVKVDGINLDIKNLTHARLEKLLVELKEMNLSFEGVPFKFYSES